MRAMQKTERESQINARKKREKQLEFAVHWKLQVLTSPSSLPDTILSSPSERQVTAAQ
jgi:hypothetical protein